MLTHLQILRETTSNPKTLKSSIPQKQYYSEGLIHFKIYNTILF